MVLNTETHSWALDRVWDFRALIPNEASSSSQAPPLRVQRAMQKRGSRDRKSQRWRMTLRKQCFPDPVGPMHIGTTRDCDSTHKIHIGSDQTKSHSKGGGSKVPPPTRKIFVIDTCWKREKSVFPTVCYWLYQIYSREGSVPRGCWPTQTDSMFVRTCVPMIFDLCSLVWYFCLIIFSVCLFLLISIEGVNI